MKTEARNPLVIRTDASPKIGIGHTMRCLALAQAWQDTGGKTTFVMATDALALETRFKEEGMKVARLSVQPGSNEDAVQTASIAQQIGASWVVVDGYQFGADFQRVIKDCQLPLLFIDDNGHAKNYYTDIVLNQNPHANRDIYFNKEDYTRLLLGTPYILLRREFHKWRDWKRDNVVSACKVLVTLGGGDIEKATLKVLQSIRQVKIEGLEVVLVVGASNPLYRKIKSAVRDSHIAIRLERNPRNMPELMGWADVAISAAGTTSLELAYMGLPNLVLALSENQGPIAEQLEQLAVAINLGWHETFQPSEMASRLKNMLTNAEMRRGMAERGKQLVDGDGTARVLMHMQSEAIEIREATIADRKLIWEWANDPEVRKASFSSQPIPWDHHVKWFDSTINDPNRILYIGTINQGAPIGQIRFDIKENAAVISINVDQKMRGKGYGSLLIWHSSQKLFNRHDINTIHGHIKPKNILSMQAFKKAGFRVTGKGSIKGIHAIHLTLKKNEVSSG